MLSRNVWGSSSARLGVIVLGVILVTGCASCPPSGGGASQSAPAPQRAIGRGEYAKLLADNRRLLEKCKRSTGCDVALFNLGFVHASPQSPYYDPPKAVQYFDELLKKYPRSSWANEARAWRALLHENVALEEKRRRLETEFRSKDATVRSLQMQLDRSRDLDIEYDKKKWELLH